MNKYVMSYNEFLDIINDLAHQIEEYMDKNGRFSHITGVARGGIVPAIYLSHKLNISYVERDHFMRYRANAQESHLPQEQVKYIICEDIVDTSKTIQSLRKNYMMSQDKVAALCIRDITPKEHYPAFYSKIYDRFTVFPWEVE